MRLRRESDSHLEVHSGRPRMLMPQPDGFVSILVFVRPFPITAVDNNSPSVLQAIAEREMKQT